MCLTELQLHRHLCCGVFDTIFGIGELLEMDEVTRYKILENMTTERALTVYALPHRRGYINANTGEVVIDALEIKAGGNQYD